MLASNYAWCHRYEVAFVQVKILEHRMVWRSDTKMSLFVCFV